MKYSLPAIIFAGGKSSRMGKDKSLLPFGTHKSLAAYQHHRLSELFEHVYLSAKEDKFDLQAPVIEDRYAIHSPLVGIISAFEALPQSDSIFVLSVDAPFIDAHIIHSLIEHKKNEDAVVARNHIEVQPLCGLYSRSILPLAKAQMHKGNHKLKALLDKAHTGYVDFKEAQAFTNLNYPDEYEKARGLTS